MSSSIAVKLHLMYYTFPFTCARTVCLYIELNFLLQFSSLYNYNLCFVLQSVSFVLVSINHLNCTFFPIVRHLIFYVRISLEYTRFIILFGWFSLKPSLIFGHAVFLVLPP